MKSNKVVRLVALSVVFLLSCGTEMKNNAQVEMQVNVCGVENPQWLLTQVSDILKQSSNFRPVRVFNYKETEDEIVAIEDAVNSNASKGLMFFDCSGKQIEFDSDRYKELSALLKEGKFTSLWSNK